MNARLNKILHLRRESTLHSEGVVIAEGINNLCLVGIKLLAGLLNLCASLVDLVAVIDPVAVDIDSGRQMVYFTSMLRGTDSALEVT